MTIDTLAYANYLKENGIKGKDAETHKQAINQFVITELSTKQDLREMELRLKIHLTVIIGGLLVLFSAIEKWIA